MGEEYLPWASLTAWRALDGIDPPTGGVKGRAGYNVQNRGGGIEAQVLRWSGFPGRVPEREQNPYKYHTTDHKAHTNRV